MKNRFIKLALILFAVNLCHSQAWMESLEFAQKLALVQNKMVLMVWEETTEYDYPVFVDDDKGRTLFIRNLFTDETLSPLIWEHFVPVIVSEDEYADLYIAAKGKRKQAYIDKLNDDGIKIMDVNGNILNVSMSAFEHPNISKLIQLYALNTSLISSELKNYSEKKTFYSSYYLASKYLDLALYANKAIRPELIDLANIYLDEAKVLSVNETEDDGLVLKQRCKLLNIQEALILKRPKKVLRQLKKIDTDEIENNNKDTIAFLYYTAYAIIGDKENTDLWKPKLSFVNLKKAHKIINLNS